MPYRSLPVSVLFVLLLGTASGLYAIEVPPPGPGSWWRLWDAAWLEEGFGLGRALLSNLELDAPAEDFVGALRKSSEDLDLGRIYKKLGNGPGARRIVLAGARTGDAFWIRRVAEPPQPPVDALGSFVAQLELRPDELAGIPGEGFDAGLGWRLQTAGLGWAQVRAVAAASRELAVLRREMPRTFELLDQLMEGEDLAAAGAGRLHWRLRLRPEALDGRWPHLARFVHRLGELVEVQAALHTPSGRRLAGLQGRGGVLELDETADPAPLMVLTAEVSLRDRGLRATIGPIHLPLEWKPAETVVELRASLERPPPIELEGKALYVIPTSVIDFFIPGNIEGLARDFAAALARSEAGAGWQVDWRHDGSLVELQARGKILDNGLIQLGAGLVNRRLRLGEVGREEARSLLREVLGRLEQDWRASVQEP